MLGGVEGVEDRVGVGVAEGLVDEEEEEAASIVILK